LQQVGGNCFFFKICNLQILKQTLVKRRLRETDIKHCKTTCRFELDIGPDTAYSAVELNSTLNKLESKYIYVIHLYFIKRLC